VFGLLSKIQIAASTPLSNARGEVSNLYNFIIFYPFGNVNSSLLKFALQLTVVAPPSLSNISDIAHNSVMCNPHSSTRRHQVIFQELARLSSLHGEWRIKNKDKESLSLAINLDVDKHQSVLLQFPM